MKKLSIYVQEKCLINKNTHLYTKLDMNDKDMLINILKAEFISLYMQHFNDVGYHPSPFKQKGISTYSIRRTLVNYKNIIDILNKEYNYEFDVDEVSNKNSDMYKLLNYYLKPLEDLINFKTTYVKYINQNISGSDIYWKDFKSYYKKQKS